jgi:hypothetical protein
VVGLGLFEAIAEPLAEALDLLGGGGAGRAATAAGLS